MYVCPLLEGGLIEFTGTQIRVTPDPEIRGEAPASPKNFWALRASVWCKYKGRGQAPRAPPLDPPLV